MSLLDSRHRPFRLLTEELVVAREEGSASERSASVSRVPESNERIAAQIARIVPRDIQPLVALPQRRVVALEPVRESHVRLRAGGRRVTRARASRCRDSTGRRPGRCRSRRPARRARRGSRSGIAAGACVQYERHFVESTKPGSSSAPVGQASMQSVHDPQSSASGGVASTAAVVTSVPSTTQEP